MSFSFVLTRTSWLRVRSYCQLFFVCSVLLFCLKAAGAAQFGVSAEVQKSPARITLSWDSPPWGAASYTVYRSTVIGGFPGGGGSWSAIAAGITGTSYVDNSVQVGANYEYRIERTGSSFNGNAYISSGIEVPMEENRGKLILVVDDFYTSSLATEINQLISDLTGDGWVVVRHNVSRSATPASVRALIQADYNAAPASVRAVYLLGRVPVLRSGNLNPDGHTPRAMPADGFYGDVDGNWNNPTYLPSDVDLQVGRVDLYGMPAFLPLTDVDLTRQYLNRAHGWKHKLWTVPNRHAQMSTETGKSIHRQFFGTTDPTIIPNVYYAGNGYYSPEFWSEVEGKDYLWFTKGSGGGAYNACAGMGSTYHYAASPGVRTVFNAEFASYFEEWDVTDNFLRAPLAAKGNALTDVWSDNPAWVFMHMGMGKNIGFSTRVSQNNDSYYNVPGYNGLPHSRRGVHMALMGDPTLRMHIVAPPSNLVVRDNTNSASLSWNASPDSSLLGYAVYRSTNPSGPFTRLNSTLISGLNYTDSNVAGGPYTYMVRAVKLEVTPSGSYQNFSQGTFGNNTAGRVELGSTITSITSLANRTIRLNFRGAPGTTYRIQANSNLSSANWITLGTRTASTDGTFQFDDAGAATNSMRFYRTATP